MNIIDRQQVQVAELVAEGVQLVGLEGDDVLVGEILGRQVQPAAAGTVLVVAVADALEEVRFADPVAAVQEKRVKRAAVATSK
jgi:hypothetical protein